MVVMAGFLLVAIITLGLLFLRLYALPQRIVHRGRKLQASIVAILCIIALFTQIYGFWIAALVLALIEIPDFGGWMPRIAAGVERLAGINPAEPSTEPPSDESHAEAKPDGRGGYPYRADRRERREERRTGS